MEDAAHRVRAAVIEEGCVLRASADVGPQAAAAIAGLGAWFVNTSRPRRRRGVTGCVVVMGRTGVRQLRFLV